MKKSRRIFWTLLKVAISAVVLVALIWHFKNDLPSLATVNRLSAAEAVVLLLLQPALIGLRWWLLLRQYGSRTGVTALTSVTWVSVFANQFLPAGIGGDAVRVVYACRLGNGLGAATASVLMDRIMALVALVLLILIFAPHLPQAVDFRIVEVLGLVCAVCVVLLGAIYVYVRAARHQKHSAFIQRVLNLIVFVLQSIERPFATAAAILLSITVHVISFAAFYVIVRGLSISVSMPSFVAVSALLTFIQIIPISIGGWGVREIAAISLLGMIGVEAGPALLASLLLGMCYAVASLPGAIIWPFMRGSGIEDDTSRDAPVG
ncbi:MULTISPECIES: lysylphosphatidylglycerol synthase transmembrane domain-containing protein [unclassified Rhizobium]